MKKSKRDNDLSILIFIKIFTVRIEDDFYDEFLNTYTPKLFNSIVLSNYKAIGNTLDLDYPEAQTLIANILEIDTGIQT